MKKISILFLGGCFLSLSMAGCMGGNKPTDPAILQVKADSIYAIKSKMVTDSFNAAMGAKVSMRTDSIVNAKATAGK